MLQLLLNDPQLSGKQLANSIMVLLLCVFKVRIVYIQLYTKPCSCARLVCGLVCGLVGEKWSGQLLATAMHMVK